MAGLAYFHMLSQLENSSFLVRDFLGDYAYPAKPCIPELECDCIRLYGALVPDAEVTGADGA
jgi:hypothetical protein